MGNLCVDGEVISVPLEAHCDASCSTSLLDNCFGFLSSTDEIFTCLLTLTTYISHQLIHFLEDLMLSDTKRNSEYLVAHTSELHSKSSGHCLFGSSAEGCSCTLHAWIADISTWIHEINASLWNEETPITTRYGVINSSYSHQAVSCIVQGLMLPLYSLRLALWFMLACCRCSFCYIRYAQVQVCRYKIMTYTCWWLGVAPFVNEKFDARIISRVRKTLRGSSDDIGWLQCMPGIAPVKDGTVRFLELLDKIRDGKHTLPNTFVYLLIPGLFSNHSPLYFVGTKRFFSKMGLACHIAKIHSETSVEHNAWELKQYIEELYWGSGKRVMLLGHSKGGVDAAAALSIYWPDLKDKVAGLALVQSPYGGSPLASDILREGQIADKETRRIMELIICKLIKGDIRALEDLSYDKRREFIMKYKLPCQIPLISFHSEASAAPGVLATMTHIAHAELPWLPLPNCGHEESDIVQSGHQVPVVIPLSAAMALCALHLQLRYGEKSDGLVTCRDAEVPGSVVVRPDRKLDHAWMVYSSWKKDPSKPDSCEMCEALLTMLVELGMAKEHSDLHSVVIDPGKA